MAEEDEADRIPWFTGLMLLACGLMLGLVIQHHVSRVTGRLDALELQRMRESSEGKNQAAMEKWEERQIEVTARGVAEGLERHATRKFEPREENT